jgi:hypothetical protein
MRRCRRLSTHLSFTLESDTVYGCFYAFRPRLRDCLKCFHGSSAVPTILFSTVYGGTSRYSDWLRAGRRRGRSSSSGKVKNFLFSTLSRPALGSTQPSNQLGTECSFAGGKAAGAWRWPLTSNWVPRSRKRGTVHPICHTPSWRKCLIS